MSMDHGVGKLRQLETASSSDLLESDEQLARRLHEELNALTRHARRGAPPSQTSVPQQQLQGSKSEKLLDSKLARNSSKQRVPTDAEVQTATAPADKPARKRSMLNRELAMLVTDMVESQYKPATGPRQTKSKDEQVDHPKVAEQAHTYAVEQLLPILKHESSSSQSEQERLALEHVQAVVADGTPMDKAGQQRPRFAARTSDSGADAVGDSGCISGATSSGRDSSNSSGDADHGQQHTSPAVPDQQQQQDLEQQRSRQQQPPQKPQQRSVSQAKGKEPRQQDVAVAAKAIKIPKLPMIEYAKKWYRAKVLKDAGSKVLLEYQGYSHEGGPFWLPKNHPRVWRGSYKGRDWKYLGDGAWEPKTSNKSDGKLRHPKLQRSSSAAAGATTATNGAAADSDTEQTALRHQRRHAQQQKHKKQHSFKAVIAAAAVKTEHEAVVRSEGTVSERDTTSADQQGEQPAERAEAVGPTCATSVEQVEVDSAMHAAGDMHTQEPQQQELQQAVEHRHEVRKGAQQSAAAVDLDEVAAPGEVCGKQGSAGVAAVGQQFAGHVDSMQLDTGSVHHSAGGADGPLCSSLLLLEAASSKAADATDTPTAATADKAAAHGQLTTALENSKVVKVKAAVDSTEAAGRPSNDMLDSASAAVAPASAKVKGICPLLIGHTHEEMVAAAVAAVAVAAPPAPRGRSTRSGRSHSARSGAEGASDGSKRGGRGGSKNAKSGAVVSAAAAALAAATGALASAAAAPKQQPSKTEHDQQQQAAQAVAQQPARSGSGTGSAQGPQPGCLRVEPGRAMKHSGSSDGPLSPTSPCGGSPRAHRRKGVPRRSRLDSEDLQRPTKKARGAPKPAAYCETAMEWQQHEQQVQLQHMQELRRQQAQLHAQQQQAAWRAAAKNGFGGNGTSAKKSIWQLQQANDYSTARDARQQASFQEHQSSWHQPSPRQHALAAATAAAAAAEQQAYLVEQQQIMLAQLSGSEPEGVEAACVLLGAALGHAQSGEVAGALDTHTAAGAPSLLAQRSVTMTAVGETPISPHVAVKQAGGAKRKGHNGSKPLTSNSSRPPRPPLQLPGQQGGNNSNARLSLNGSLPQQLQLQRFGGSTCAEQNLTYGLSGQGARALRSCGAFEDAALTIAVGATGGNTAVNLLGPQGSSSNLVASTSLVKLHNGSSSIHKQETLRALLDAVGELQYTSGRTDLMFPLQLGGVPLGSQALSKDGRGGTSAPQLQLLHMDVSPVAASLLAAVPDLDTVHRMAVMQGQAGVLACLSGQSPSLFL